MTQEQVSRIRELFDLFSQETEAQKLSTLASELSKLLELEVQEMDEKHGRLLTLEADSAAE